MHSQLTKALCESLLQDGSISGDTVTDMHRFSSLADDLLNCVLSTKNLDQVSVNGIKKTLGKLISSKARVLKVDDAIVKMVKSLLYDKINNQVAAKAVIRRLKVGKNRQIYSDDEQDVIELKQQETGSTAEIHSVKRAKIQRKRKYKTFDQDFKQEVCQVANQLGIDQATKKFNLSTRKVTSWLEAQSVNLLGKGRKALDPAMEFNMSVWILKKIWNQVPLTQKVIRQKAATMKTININFNGSKGWLQKFFLRHVELKSCFDTRSKLEMREECARYHRCAFGRVFRDYENLVKMKVKASSLVSGDFCQIIYGEGNHPILKLDQDVFIDQQRDKTPFYDYEKLKDMPVINFNKAKKEEQDQYDSEHGEQSEEEFDDQDDQDDEIGDQESEVDEKIEEESQNDEQEDVVKIYQEDESAVKSEEEA